MRLSQHGGPSRRGLLRSASLLAAPLVFSQARALIAQLPAPLDVASAGSIRDILNGPVKQAAAQQLGLDLQVHAGGADAMARGVVDGSIPADVFVPITAGPMRTVMQAGKTHVAHPIAATEMVILYSPKSVFAPQFEAAGRGQRAWWEILRQPSLKFARSNLEDDPSGRSIIFTMMLAAGKYGEPDLVREALGAPLNPAQVQPGVNVRAGLENGTIDAAGGYKVAAMAGRLPHISLPDEINLSQRSPLQNHPEIQMTVGGKTFRPEPLLFYAAVIGTGGSGQNGSRFLDWIRGPQAASLLSSSGLELPQQAAPILRA